MPHRFYPNVKVATLQLPPQAKTLVVTYISTMQVEVCVHDRFYPTVKVATLQLPSQAKIPVVTYISTMQMEFCVHERFYPNIKVATLQLPPRHKTPVVTYISTVQTEVCVYNLFHPNIKVATLLLPAQAKTPVITYICTMQMESVCITMTMFPNRTNMLSILFLSTGHHGAPPVLPDQRLLLMKKIITRMEKPIWAYVKSQDTLYIFTINKSYNLYISRIYI